MKVTQEQLTQMRRLIHELGWAEFMSNVGSLMAEQVEKTPEPQSSCLFKSASTIHALRTIWEECGHFKYPQEKI